MCSLVRANMSFLDSCEFFLPPSQTHARTTSFFLFFLFLFVDFFGHESQPVRWQESARLYWIITPDWFHLVHAPALLIWQSCGSAVRNDAQTKRRRERKKERKQTVSRLLPLLLLLCLLWCVFLLSVYQNVRPDPPLMNYSAAPPPPLPALILAFVSL